MKTDELPSEAEKEEQKAEASTNTNGKQQERRAFWEKGNGDVYRSEFFSPSVALYCSIACFPFLSVWSPIIPDPSFAKAGLILEPKAV